MKVFNNHTVICGWNSRGKTIVQAMQSLSGRPILVITSDIKPVINDVGKRSNLFVVAGDCSKKEVLLSADVDSAHCVLVLAQDDLGNLADARSVQIALAVEKIQASVHTVVEIHNIQNKTHFSWTKVDELVAQEEISVRMMAQGIRHTLNDHRAGHREGFREALLMKTYRQLVAPERDKVYPQIFRVDLIWHMIRELRFGEILGRGLERGLLPVALVGFREHEIESRGDDTEDWRSWKAELRSNPDPDKRIGEIWKIWPEYETYIGVILLASTREEADSFAATFG